MTKKPWFRILCIFLSCFLSVQCVSASVGASEVEEEVVIEYKPEPMEEPTATEEPEEEAAPEPKTIVVYRESPESADAEETEPAETTPVETVEELPEYLQIPLYFQTDYPETMYGSGSIASSGCSITSLAMVATYLTGHEFLPDELARYFGGRAENNIKRLEIGSKEMQLPFEKSPNFHKTIEGLQEGKVAIALMKRGSLFTRGQHFIVLTGITEDGLIMVNDPNEDNYDVWNLKKGLRYGFEQKDILKGYDGAWLYDKSQMPEEPFIYYQEDIDRSNPRYPHINLTLAETRLLAKVVWVEAQGESFEGQQAVAEVVLNRLNSDLYGNTLNNVIYAENQFRSVPFLDDAKPYQTQYEAIERAIYGPYVLPEDVMHFATYPTNEFIWGQIGGHIFCYEWGHEGDE